MVPCRNDANLWHHARSHKRRTESVILTPSEFCGILMDLRDSYDLRDMTNELGEKPIRKRRVFVDMDNVLVDFEFGPDFQSEDIKIRGVL